MWLRLPPRRCGGSASSRRRSTPTSAAAASGPSRTRPTRGAASTTATTSTAWRSAARGRPRRRGRRGRGHPLGRAGAGFGHLHCRRRPAVSIAARMLSAWPSTPPSRTSRSCCGGRRAQLVGDGWPPADGPTRRRPLLVALAERAAADPPASRAPAAPCRRTPRRFSRRVADAVCGAGRRAAARAARRALGQPAGRRCDPPGAGAARRPRAQRLDLRRPRRGLDRRLTRGRGAGGPRDADRARCTAARPARHRCWPTTGRARSAPTRALRELARRGPRASRFWPSALPGGRRPRAWHCSRLWRCRRRTLA